MSGAGPAETFAGRLAAALASPEGGPLGVLLHAPTVTVIVADPRDDAWLEAGLPVMLAALDRAGVWRGRALVLLAETAPEGRGPEAARALRRVLGVPVIAHDGARSSCYGAGRTPAGVLVELNDELREAEAIVVFAAARAAAGDDPGASGLVFPGLASRASAVAAAREGEAGRRAACACAPVDLAVHWRPGMETDVWAGPGTRSDAAIAHMAGRLDPSGSGT